MSKIRQLLDMPIVGNAYSDRKLFSLAHEIIMSEDTSMSMKKVAIRKIDEAMGADPLEMGEVEQAVVEYIAFNEKLAGG